MNTVSCLSRQRVCSFFVLLIFIVTTDNAFAQQEPQFNYSVNASAAGEYAPLNQAQQATQNGSWNFCYRLPIGFSFPFLGSRFDSVFVETNGYLVFDKNRDYAFTAFSMFGDAVDKYGSHSSLAYALSGTPGNHVLKIQFNNVGRNGSGAMLLDYQVWLLESGDLELHVGPNDFQPDSIHPLDSSLLVRIGMLNMNMDTRNRGYFIRGSAEQSSGQPMDDQHPDPVYLLNVPPAGTRYVFSPVGQ